MNIPVTELNRLILHRLRHQLHRLSPIYLCLLLGILAFITAGWKLTLRPMTTPPAQRQGIIALATPSPTVELDARPLLSPTTEITPTVTVTPAVGITVTVTPSPTQSTRLKRGTFPPLTRLLEEGNDYFLGRSLQSIEEVEEYYLQNTYDSYLLDQLWAPVNQYGGRSFFLLFWKDSVDDNTPPMAACIHAYEKKANSRPTYIMRGECSITREKAELTRRTPWERPKDVNWVTWENEEVSFAYPDQWQVNEEYLARAYCQTPPINCLAAFRSEDKSGVEQFTLIRQPREDYMTPFDYAQAEYSFIQQGDRGHELLTMFPILLERGQEAYQAIYLYYTPEGIPAIHYSIHLVTEDEYYVLTGVTLNGTPELSANYAIINVAGRTLRFKAK